MNVFSLENPPNMKFRKKDSEEHACNTKSRLHNTDVVKCGNDSEIALLYVTVEGLRDFPCCVLVCYKLSAGNITLPYTHGMKEKNKSLREARLRL